MKFNLLYNLPHESDNFLYDVLQAKGIKNCDLYMNPITEQCQYDAALLDNIDTAASLLHSSIENREKIYMIVD